MSQLDTIMAESGLPALRQIFGDDATYTPAYTPPATAHPVATWAMLAHAGAFVGQYGERWEDRLTAELPKADVGTPQPGDALTVGSTTYRIDQVLDDTGSTIKVAIR